MTGLCKDCRWWSPPRQEVINLMGRCELTRELRKEPRHADTLAVARGQAFAYLETSPNFGCVQHSTKGEEVPM